MARISLKDLHVRFGEVAAVDGVNLEIEDGEFVVFLGPSGCGKTTTLRCIAGLEQATSGQILFDGKPVNTLDAIHRNVAMVFQFVSLYPHLTIRRNIAFPLEARGTPKAEIEEKINWVSGIFGLESILDQRPRKLPPGARQKAALARAVVRNPNVLLLDEPLSAIDEQFREEMRWELRHLQKRLGVTSIYVTHDQREAMSLADRIVLMRDGIIEQQGAPLDLFERPASTFVAGFLGSPKMSFLPGRLTETAGLPAVQVGKIALPLPAGRTVNGSGADQPILLGLRPEHLMRAQGEAPAAGCYRYDATIDMVQPTGSRSYANFLLSGEQVIAELRAHDVSRPGETLPIDINMNRASVFDAATGRAL